MPAARAGPGKKECIKPVKMQLNKCMPTACTAYGLCSSLHVSDQQHEGHSALHSTRAAFKTSAADLLDLDKGCRPAGDGGVGVWPALLAALGQQHGRGWEPPGGVLQHGHPACAAAGWSAQLRGRSLWHPQPAVESLPPSEFGRDVPYRLQQSVPRASHRGRRPVSPLSRKEPGVQVQAISCTYDDPEFGKLLFGASCGVSPSPKGACILQHASHRPVQVWPTSGKRPPSARSTA